MGFGTRSSPGVSRCRSGSGWPRRWLSLAPGAAYLWLLPLLSAGLLLSILPVSSAVAVRVASVVVFLIAATLWLPNTVDLLRFVVAIFGRLPVVTPVFIYAAVMTVAGVMLVPPLVAAIARTKPLRFPKLATAACLLAVAATGKFAHMAPAYTNEEPLRRAARAVQEGDGPAIWDVGSVEPGVDLGEGAPSSWMPAASAPTASVPVRPLPHPFVFRSAGPSLGPAPITIAALSVEPVEAGIELAVTVIPRHPGLAVSFVFPDGLAPARSNLRGYSASASADGQRPISRRRPTGWSSAPALARSTRPGCASFASSPPRLAPATAPAGSRRRGCPSRGPPGRRKPPGSWRPSRCRLHRCRRYVRLRNRYGLWRNRTTFRLKPEATSVASP